jgi:hypothetical protein
MSYDVYLRGEVCGSCGHRAEGPSLPDPTYNLTDIFDLALTGEPLPSPEVREGAVVIFHEKTARPRGLRLLSGRKGSETILMIENALKRMEDPAWYERLLALEPKNKWGSLPGARDVMGKLLRAAKEYPGHVWEIH